ncbi:hypothetical protein ACIHJG_39430, partial [Streptomyces sp. NPDC052415]
RPGVRGSGRWWEQPLRGERETVWLRRLRVVTQGGDLRRWRIVGRDVVTFPEVLAVADPLVDSATAELAWLDTAPAPAPAAGAARRRGRSAADSASGSRPLWGQSVQNSPRDWTWSDLPKRCSLAPDGNADAYDGGRQRPDSAPAFGGGRAPDRALQPHCPVGRHLSHR